MTAETAAASSRLLLHRPATPRPHQQIRSLIGSAIQVFAIRVIGAALAYTSMVLLARWLGAYQFGIFAFVLVIVTQLGLAFSFGLNSATLRFVADYRARGKTSRLHGYLRRSYALVVGMSCAGALVSAGLLLGLGNRIEPYGGPLLIGLLCVPIWSLLNQLESTARAFGWVHVAYIPGYVLRPTMLIAAVGMVVAFGGATNATSALWALLGACALAAAAQGTVVYSGTLGPVAGSKPSYHTRHWLGISLSFLMIDGFRILLDNTDLIMVGQLLDPQSVAVYFAVIRTGGLVAFISFATIALAVPKFAELHSTGRRAELQKLVSQVIHVMFWPSLVAAVVLAIIGPFVLALFGADFTKGYPTLLVVLVGLVLRTATLPAEYLLTMTGHHRDTLCVYALAALATIGLNFLLIPPFGITGAAIASYAAMLGGNICLYMRVRKHLGVSAFLWPLPRLRGVT